MRMIIIVASSLDGFITKGDDPKQTSWTSKEDKESFDKIRVSHSLYVMGRNTYEVFPKNISADTLRVVLTRNPEDFSDKEVPGQLTFESLAPEEFVNKYEKIYETCLVLGGSYVYNSFLQAGLIDEIYMTVEPVNLVSGVPFIKDNKKLEEIIDLPDPTVKKLNASGTVLKHYILKK